MQDTIGRYCRPGHIAQIFDRTKHALLGEFHRATKRAGLPQIRIHDLRHSHVAMLIDMRFSIEEIAERLGHESAAITWKTYAHLYPGKDRELAKRLEKARHASITGLQTSTAGQGKNKDNTDKPESLTSD